MRLIPIHDTKSTWPFRWIEGVLNALYRSTDRCGGGRIGERNWNSRCSRVMSLSTLPCVIVSKSCNYRVWPTLSAFKENRRHSPLSRLKRYVMGWSETRLLNPIRISESD